MKTKNAETKEKHTPEPWHVGQRSGHNASMIYAYDGDDPMNDTGICQVYNLPMNTTIEEIRNPDRTIPKQAARTFAKGLANADRIVSCVNACAGIADPVAAIAAARDALEETLALSERFDLFGAEFADKLAAALALLTPTVEEKGDR